MAATPSTRPRNRQRLPTIEPGRFAALASSYLTLEFSALQRRGPRAELEEESTLNRIPRRLRGVIIGLVIATLPMAVVATDVFTDVSDSSQFHDPINALAGAGVTAGSPSGSDTFQPQADVNRQQMAGFLNRAAGRIAYSGNGADLPAPVSSTAGGTELATLTLSPGGVVADKTNMFKADATLTVFCNDLADDCQVLVTIDDGDLQSRVASYNVPAGEVQHGALTWANETATGSNVTLTLRAISTGAGDAEATGEMTAIYAPFGAGGGNTLAP
jgi:hypothetical protein